MNITTTWTIVDKIRELYTTTPLSQKQIAERVGVTRCVVSRVVNRQAWKPERRPKGKGAS